MRSLYQPILADVVAVSAAVGIIGLSYGATAQTAGFPLWLTLAMALGVLSGTAEMLFVAVIGAGGAPFVAALGGILAGVRNGIYGVSVAPVLHARWERLLGAHLVNDEVAAFAAARRDPGARRRAFWTLGIGVLLCWVSGAFLGQLLGRYVIDPRAIGLDAAFPALLLAILLGLARDVPSRAASAAGAVIAGLSAPWVAAGLAPVLALAGLAVPYLGRRGRRPA